MNNYLPINEQHIDDEPPTSLYERAGLICVGEDEDGELQYQGTKKQWERFEKLTEEYENS